MSDSKSSPRSNPILAALLTLGCLCVSATEAREVEPVEFTFQFAPTDLATPSGSDRVYGRLVQSARKACKSFGSGREIWRSELRDACQADLIDKVVAQIGRQELTARHRSSAYFDLARQLEGELGVRR
jgi:UrcA family protein